MYRDEQWWEVERDDIRREEQIPPRARYAKGGLWSGVLPAVSVDAGSAGKNGSDGNHV